ncbi:MAG TPA: hypothetical protein VK056_00020 [Bacillota bacterium]|nr:hypothetical protein [Bacillota bacterium]
MKLQKINDERLIIKNLKNIRLVYIVQTFGIIGLLVYDAIAHGLSSLKANPLSVVLIASTAVLAFLSYNATDERLVFNNLKKIRIAYVIQMLGIIGILGYDYLLAKDINVVYGSPLWFVFIVSTTVLLFLSMNISVDYESGKKSANKGLAIQTIVLVLVSCTVGFFTVYLDEHSSFFDGLLMGGILFVCGFIVSLVLYRLRKSRE